MSFNLTWAQRIETEERSFLAGATAAKEAKATQKAAGRSPDGRQRRRSSRRGTALSAAGDSLSRSPSSPSVLASEASHSRSALQSSSSRGSALRSSSAAMADIPEHLSAVARFPVADKDLLTARV